MSTSRDIDGLADTHVIDGETTTESSGERSTRQPSNSPKTASTRPATGSAEDQPWTSLGSLYGRSLPLIEPQRYQRLGEYARGGLGRITKARDLHLGRTVAIKELLRVSDFAESLFVREALITARLQHPGIVPVHEAGRWPSGEPFYAMKLVSGSSLLERLRDADNLTDRLVYLPNIITVVETIAYAHSEGILHRDIKPANIIVGDFGETVVVDWGLARDDKQPVPFPSDLAEVELTALSGGDSTDTAWLRVGNYSVSGKVVGTPAYMSPEQAQGKPATPKSDIYALGSLLYEVLAGSTPYPGKDPQVVLEKVLAGPPEPLADIDCTIPPDLVTIVAKAMARDPDDRYESAKDLAEDLKRFQTGHLVSAHRYSPWALARRWLWRHRSPVLVAAIALVVLAVMGAVSINRVVAAKNQAQVKEKLAITAKDKIMLMRAKSSLPYDPTKSLALLKRIPLDGQWFLYARNVFHKATASGVAKHVIGHGSRVMTTTFTPDGKHVVSASLDGTVRLIRADTGAECILERDDDHKFINVAISPDGRRVAAGARDGTIRLLQLSASHDVTERIT